MGKSPFTRTLLRAAPGVFMSVGVKPGSPLTSFEMRGHEKFIPTSRTVNPSPLSLLLLNIRKRTLSEGVFLLYLPEMIIDKTPLISS